MRNCSCPEKRIELRDEGSNLNLIRKKKDPLSRAFFYALNIKPGSVNNKPRLLNRGGCESEG